MTKPAQEQTTAIESRWIPLWNWLWKVIVLLWSLFFLGIIDSIIATRLTSDKDFPIVSPVGRAMQNFPLTLSLGLILLLLTALFWILHRQLSIKIIPLPSERDRLVLIQTLRQEYVRQLTRSLQGATMMELHLHERTDITLSSAQFVFRRTQETEEHSLPLGTSIIETYDHAGRGLLILGEPGSGKTTLLTTLAKELAFRAESDLAHPIPVIVNLSSWAIKQPPLATWLIEQLYLIYRIPTFLSKALMEHNQWLFLLDGLDEVETSVREKCIEAINIYQGEHFMPLVVSSRKQEYLTLKVRLALPTAVIIQPLQKDQVMDYLKRVGKSMTAVRTALRTNPILQNIITTPLMLSILILTYRDKAAKDLPSLGSIEQQQLQIFNHYVEHMLARPVANGVFKPQQIRHWLSKLAQMMKQAHLSEFYLEHLQPTWLPTKRSHTNYLLLFGLLTGLLAGLLIGLFFGLLIGLLKGLLVGLLVGVSIGLPFGLYTGIYLVRMQITQKTTLADVLSWSWKKFLKLLFIGLLIGLLISLFMYISIYNYYPFNIEVNIITSLAYGLLGALLFTFSLGLLAGFSTQQITEHSRLKPNQGVRSSGRNAFYIVFISMLLLCLPLWLFIKLFLGLLTAPLLALLFGLTMGLGVGSNFGGAAYLQHYILRYLFWRHGMMPLRYISFLEEANERILLQKVGGGYRFIHPLFLDYFASQPPAISHNQTPQPQTQNPT